MERRPSGEEERRQFSFFFNLGMTSLFIIKKVSEESSSAAALLCSLCSSLSFSLSLQALDVLRSSHFCFSHVLRSLHLQWSCGWRGIHGQSLIFGAVLHYLPQHNQLAQKSLSVTQVIQTFFVLFSTGQRTSRWDTRYDEEGRK